MTLINSPNPVRCLTDEHLLAEHREIKRLPFCLQQAIKSGSINRIPYKFTLGKGHVLFFLDKMLFCVRRYNEIDIELSKRGFTLTDFAKNWENVPYKYTNDYVVTDEERKLLIERITERINNSTKKHWHYYGKEISKSEAIDLLNSEIQ